MEAKLAQRRHDLCTLLKTSSIGTQIILAQFKEGLRKEAGNLHDVIGVAVKQLKKTGRADLARDIEKEVKQIYAPPRQRHSIEKLKPPSRARHFAIGTKS